MPGAAPTPASPAAAALAALVHKYYIWFDMSLTSFTLPPQPTRAHRLRPPAPCLVRLDSQRTCLQLLHLWRAGKEEMRGEERRTQGQQEDMIMND